MTKFWLLCTNVIFRRENPQYTNYNLFLEIVIWLFHLNNKFRYTDVFSQTKTQKKKKNVEVSLFRNIPVEIDIYINLRAGLRHRTCNSKDYKLPFMNI